MTDPQAPIANRPSTTATLARRRPRWVALVVGLSLLAMVVVTGLIVSFSLAVMPNLIGVDDETFILTMHRYNLNPVFPLAFTVASVFSILAVIVNLPYGLTSATAWAAIALTLFLLVNGVTAVVHVPLTAQVDAAAGDIAADVAQVRAQVEFAWSAWNLVRTLLAVGAVAALARSLYLIGRHDGRSDWQTQGS